MLNSSPLNSSPLNAGSTGAAEPEEPIIIGPSGPIDPDNPPPQPGEGTPGGHVWSVTVSGHSADLTGIVSVQHSNKGDAVAQFSYVGGLAGVGGAVSIHFNGALLFTGAIEQTDYDSGTGVTTVRATTDLQGAISAMSKEQVAALIGGVWSEDVFGPLEQRDSWEYAQELLTTRPVALGVDRAGQPRVVPLGGGGAGFVFAGGAIDTTPTASVLTPDEGVTGVKVELDYRYSYRHQYSLSYSWTSVSGSGTSGFEAYYQQTHELPSVDMVRSTIEGTGWRLGTWQDTRLPPSNPRMRWYNLYLDLLLSVSFSLRTRWVQRRVESYRINVGSAEGRTETLRAVIDVPEADDAAGWEAWAIRPPGASREQERLQLAAAVLLAQANVRVNAARVTGRNSWQAPLSFCTGISGGDTVNGGAAAMVTAEIDVETGSAICTITAESHTSTGAAVPELPEAPEFPEYPSSGGGITLPNQMGILSTSEPYDPDLPGFAGNYSIGTGTLGRNPRRFAIDTPEIPADWRDEITVEVQA